MIIVVLYNYICVIFPGVGLSWSRINEPINSDNQFTMLHVLIMLIVDSIIYGIITWYLDAVIPGEYGLPRPLYFPFTVNKLTYIKCYCMSVNTKYLQIYANSIHGVNTVLRKLISF